MGKCSGENWICGCHGRVRYGKCARGRCRWSGPKDVRGTIPCNNIVFGDPYPWTGKECQCQHGVFNSVFGHNGIWTRMVNPRVHVHQNIPGRTLMCNPKGRHAYTLKDKRRCAFRRVKGCKSKGVRQPHLDLTCTQTVTKNMAGW